MRRRVLIACSALAAVAAAVVVSLGGSSPSANATSPAMSESAIRALESNVASRLGENAPTGVQHVTSTRARAVLASSGAIVDDSTPSVLIVMHGHFTDADASRPRGAPAPSGTVLTLVVDSATGQVTDLGIEEKAPDLAGLGPVVEDES